MSNKFHIPYYKISNTIYITIRDVNGNVWNTSSKTFGAWSDLSIVNYAVNAVFKEGSLYITEFPVDISNGYYTIMIFIRSGAVPVVDDDIWIGSASSYWNKVESNLGGGQVVNIDHDTAKTILERSSDPTFPIQRESS